MEFQHKSVLLAQCLEALRIRPDGIYLDGTRYLVSASSLSNLSLE